MLWYREFLASTAAGLDLQAAKKRGDRLAPAYSEKDTSHQVRASPAGVNPTQKKQEKKRFIIRIWLILVLEDYTLPVWRRLEETTNGRKNCELVDPTQISEEIGGKPYAMHILLQSDRRSPL